MSYRTPLGEVTVTENGHLTMPLRVVKITATGCEYQSQVIKQLKAEPYPYAVTGKVLTCTLSSEAAALATAAATAAADAATDGATITDGTSSSKLAAATFTVESPIRVGILHSPGSAGRRYIDAELLAIDEINTAGGLLDRPLLPIVLPCGDACSGQLLKLKNSTVVFGLDDGYWDSEGQLACWSRHFASVLCCGVLWCAVVCCCWAHCVLLLVRLFTVCWFVLSPCAGSSIPALRLLRTANCRG